MCVYCVLRGSDEGWESEGVVWVGRVSCVCVVYCVLRVSNKGTESEDVVSVGCRVCVYCVLRVSNKGTESEESGGNDRVVSCATTPIRLPGNALRRKVLSSTLPANNKEAPEFAPPFPTRQTV